MSRRRLVSVFLVNALLTAAAATARAAPFAALQPGGVTPLEETVNVNVVFVGLHPDWSAISGDLPTSGSPKTRFKLFYGLDAEADLGITYSYAYSPVFAAGAWEDAFFGYLSGIAAPQARTLFQDAYNAQAGARDVGQNHWIDAPSVERWLIANPPAGVDTTRPTLFFVSWWGRDDFIDHVYVKTGEPDPDTGYDFGLLRHSRKIVAWGGTAPDDEESGYGGGVAHRVWFYDLSAGPESWGGSYEVTSADIDGDGERDYRIPPIWEYAGSPLSHQHPGYGPARLETDLGKVIRYVGIDLLFTSSPLYPPSYRADALPGAVNLDVNTVEGWNQVDASSVFVTPELFLGESRKLTTGFESTLTADYQDVKLEGDWNRCYKQFASDRLCYNDLHPGYAAFGGFVNLFLVAARHTGEILDGGAPYEAGLVNWSIGAKPKAPGLLGFADDNWLDGTQSAVFSFVYPDAVAAGYGLTTTMIHEHGHHSSMSHPHDGLDPATGVDFGPSGDFYFAWLGDESNSIMSYVDLNWDFGQFDRDNSARHHAAGYAKAANAVAAGIPGDPGGLLTDADGELVAAQVAFGAHDYGAAVAHARQAYELEAAAAGLAGVAVTVRQPSTWTIVGPVKPGNGPSGSRKDRAAYARDLEDKANVKRMFSR
jgi:hypothetical protein